MIDATVKHLNTFIVSVIQNGSTKRHLANLFIFSLTFVVVFSFQFRVTATESHHILTK